MTEHSFHHSYGTETKPRPPKKNKQSFTPPPQTKKKPKKPSRKQNSTTQQKRGGGTVALIQIFPYLRRIGQKQKKLRPASAITPSGERACSFCGQFGHKASSCPQLGLWNDSRRSRGRSPGACWRSSWNQGHQCSWKACPLGALQCPWPLRRQSLEHPGHASRNLANGAARTPAVQRQRKHAEAATLVSKCGASRWPPRPGLPNGAVWLLAASPRLPCLQWASEKAQLHSKGLYAVQVQQPTLPRTPQPQRPLPSAEPLLWDAIEAEPAVVFKVVQLYFNGQIQPPSLADIASSVSASGTVGFQVGTSLHHPRGGGGEAARNRG